MIVATVLGIVLFGFPADLPDDVSPGEGIGLAPNPIVRQVGGPTTSGDTPRGTSHSSPAVPIPLSVALGAAVAGVGYRRRKEDPLIVVVHGDGGSAGDFRFLIRRLGIDPARVVAFDYSSVDGGRSSTESSRTVPTWAAAAALDAFLRDLSIENANIYSIHHSRGGSVGTEMIADIDEGRRPPIDGYRGAALLDPAIASGMTGVLQSVGGYGWELGERVPDDGGFDPIRCDGLVCHDVRENLGEAAGVEVVAIRNPDALITNFHGKPPGLRVFDLLDDKPNALWYLGWIPAFRNRVSEAHASVLTSETVADCLVTEIADPGSCPGLAKPRTSYIYTGTGGGGGAMKAL
jgi:pimeloyl-ACP methyl ester carboxylesterase